MGNDNDSAVIDWSEYTIGYNKELMWWEVRRVSDGVVVLSAPTSGSIVSDARAIEAQMEYHSR